LEYIHNKEPGINKRWAGGAIFLLTTVNHIRVGIAHHLSYVDRLYWLSSTFHRYVRSIAFQSANGRNQCHKPMMLFAGNVVGNAHPTTWPK
jgi:hypothetical protein